jgi:hypothetical protein
MHQTASHDMRSSKLSLSYAVILNSEAISSIQWHDLWGQFLRIIYVLVWTAALIFVGPAQAQYGVRPHPSIYLCADDQEVLDQLHRGLSSDFQIIDGETASPPNNLDEVTLAFFGRLGGAAERCASGYPGWGKILDHITSQSDVDTKDYQERLSQRGINVTGPTILTQTTVWDLESGVSTDWFIDICFLPSTEVCPGAGAVSILLDMAKAT